MPSSLGLLYRSIPAWGKHQPATLDTRRGLTSCFYLSGQCGPVVGDSRGPGPGREGYSPRHLPFPPGAHRGQEVCIGFLNLHHPGNEVLLSPPFRGWGNRVSKRLTTSPKVTQQVGGKARV